MRRGPVPGVGRGAHRVRGIAPNPAMIGQPGALTDGAVGRMGVAVEVRCVCGRVYEAGPRSERRGRRCLVCGASLFPTLDRPGPAR